MLDVVAHALLAGLTVLAWYGIGSLLLSRLPTVGDRVLDALNRLGVGAIAAALMTFVAGWARLLDVTAFRIAFALAAGIGLAFAVPLLRRVPWPRLTTWRYWELGLGALIGLYVAFGILSVSAPVTSPDALLYHVADPALFETAGRIVEIPWNSSSYEPFTVELLVLDGLLVWNAVQGAFAPFLLGLLAAATVTGATARLAGRSAALVACAIFYAQPFMLWETTSVFVEPGLAAAVALAAWNIAVFAGHRERSALVLAGVFCGGAAGMKYLGLVAAAALATAGVVLAWRRLRLAEVLAFLVPAVAVAAPWYVKNAILTGNPVYPHVFGGLNPAAAAELERAMEDDFGHGRSPLDLVLLPIRLMTHGESFDGGEWMSPLLLAFAPIALVLVAWPRRWKAAVSAGVALFVLTWFSTTQQSRFLMPLIPVAAVLAGVGAVALARRGTVGRAVAVGATAVTLAGGLAASSVYAAQFAPVVSGVESERTFLAAKVSHYEGVEWLNRRLGKDDKVAVDFWSLLYLDTPYVTFGTMGDLLPPDAGPAETRRLVTSYGITHLAILERDTARRRQAELIDARLAARVPVRAVRSRTRGELGPRQTMLVYVVR